MSILSSCYNTLGFGRWEELCHEFMASVLPMDDPRMSVDDLSSPTWRIIFLKDDCFLQPSCEVTSSSSDPDSLANTTFSDTPSHHHHHYDEEIDHHTMPSSPSSMIEPLFDEIDLNQHQHYQQHHQNQQTQHTNYTDHPTCSVSIGRLDGLNQLLSPTLSRSSSLSLSDVDDQPPTRSPQRRRTSLKIIQQQRKRKRQPQTEHYKKNKKQQRVQKRHKHHDTIIPTGNIAPITTGTTSLFDQLSFSGINWCRYCGTTEGVNWRPGPWGKRTLCNKHGCDYKGYGLASRLPRLDLSDYRNEHVEDRHHPVIQEFCAICQKRGGKAGRQHPTKQQHRQQKQSINRTISSNVESDDDDDDDSNSIIEDLVACDGGCSRAFHRHCYEIDKKNDNDDDIDAWMDQEEPASLWFCGPSCSENRRKKRVVVDLPRKQPLMRGNS